MPVIAETVKIDVFRCLTESMDDCYNLNSNSKKDGKDQETIQSSTTPGPGWIYAIA